MINATISAIEQAQLRQDLPSFRVGDTIRVHYKIVEGDKERVQVFQGVVIKRHRAGARSSFTVRKISSNVGVERVFLEHSPRVDKIDVLSRGVVRRARLYFLRELSGKAARLKDERDKLPGLRASRARARPPPPNRGEQTPGSAAVVVWPEIRGLFRLAILGWRRWFTRHGSAAYAALHRPAHHASRPRLRGPLDDPMRALRCPE